jgi:ribulose-5-phosphate 4-epimerase/fuculose-1-phosphate aldolase
MTEFKYFTHDGNNDEPEFTHNHRDFSISVEEKGIRIHGTYGWNPSFEEMAEIVEVMRFCVTAYDRLKLRGK